MVLLFAFSIIYFVTKTAYTNAAMIRIQQSLTAQLYALLDVAEEQNGEIVLPVVSRNDDLNNLNSRVFAFVFDSEGQVIWRSLSSENLPALPNHKSYYTTEFITEDELGTGQIFWVGEEVFWEFDDGNEKQLLFLIGESRTVLNASVREFKREVAVWLFVTGTLFLIILAWLQHFFLKPLKNAEKQIEQVVIGDTESISGEFPQELQALTSRINHLLDVEMRQKQRYRDTLGNLAHSLKTPLAVIKGELKKRQEDELLRKQIERIDDIVKYQLNRSVVSAGQVLKRKIRIEDEIGKIVDALKKVHRDRGLSINQQIEAIFFPGEAGDFQELIGNLADNACKWARSQVQINISQLDEILVITVEDDGKGVAKNKRKAILDRGKRLDQKAEGQGLGLSIVMDIVKNYRGEISVSDSVLGGASFCVKLPL